MIDPARFNDVVTRHQIYLEGVKHQFGIEFAAAMQGLRKEVSALLSEQTFSTFDGLTKAKFRNLVRQLKEVQNRFFGTQMKEYADKLEQFMKAELTVSKAVFSTLFWESEGKAERAKAAPAQAFASAAEESQTDGLFPLAWIASGRLFSSILSAPVPAFGLTVAQVQGAFATSSVASVIASVTKVNANNGTVQELREELFGTGSEKGVFDRVLNNFNAISNTSIQHVAINIQKGVSAFLFEHYKWVSVIDSRTSMGCIQRNGKIYAYGHGPIPPAHANCRSSIVPALLSDKSEPGTYFAWLSRQPSSVLADILGKTKADAFLSGMIKSDLLSKFSEVNPISIGEFLRKLSFILT